MDVGPVGTGESKVKGIVLLRGKFIISVVGSNELSFYHGQRICVTSFRNGSRKMA